VSNRTALTVAGVLLTVAGGASALAGGAGLVLTGGDGTASSGTHHLATSTSALVTEQGNLDGGAAAILGHPDVRIGVRNSDTKVFVGVGRARDVDAYLAGTAHEVVTDADVRPFHLSTRVVAGSAWPGPPAAQGFWLADSQGWRSARATWHVHDGTFRVVVMNADGSPGVDVDGSVTVHIPYLLGVAAGALAAGVGLTGLGVAMTVVGVRSAARAPAPPARAAPAPPYARV
jgi:hypothetical protein